MFTPVTDHKPLMTILGSTQVPSLAAARLQHWVINSQEYATKSNSGQLNSIVMQMPYPDFHWNMKDSNNGSEATFNIYQIEAHPVTATEIPRATSRDPVLSQVHHFT